MKLVAFLLLVSCYNPNQTERLDQKINEVDSTIDHRIATLETIVDMQIETILALQDEIRLLRRHIDQPLKDYSTCIKFADMTGKFNHIVVESCDKEQYCIIYINNKQTHKIPLTTIYKSLNE
jgi:uncharacterized coiled-coil protein SlyX